MHRGIFWARCVALYSKRSLQKPGATHSSSGVLLTQAAWERMASRLCALARRMLFAQVQRPLRSVVLEAQTGRERPAAVHARTGAPLAFLGWLLPIAKVLIIELSFQVEPAIAMVIQALAQSGTRGRANQMPLRRSIATPGSFFGMV